MNTKEKIIEEYNKTKVVHPSYREIAKIVGKQYSYVFRIIKAYKEKQLSKL